MSLHEEQGVTMMEALLVVLVIALLGLALAQGASTLLRSAGRSVLGLTNVGEERTLVNLLMKDIGSAATVTFSQSPPTLVLVSPDLVSPTVTHTITYTLTDELADSPGEELVREHTLEGRRPWAVEVGGFSVLTGTGRTVTVTITFGLSSPLSETVSFTLHRRPVPTPTPTPVP